MNYNVDRLGLTWRDLMRKYIIIETTTNDLMVVKKISNALIENRLSSCVSYHAVNSTYWWEGRVVREQEYVVSIKTTRRKKQEVRDELLKLHNYEVPMVITKPFKIVNKVYQTWFDGQYK